METFLFIPWIVWFILASFLANIITYDVYYEQYLRKNLLRFHVVFHRERTDAGIGLSTIFQLFILVFVVLSAILTKPWWLSVISYIAAYVLLKIYRGLFPYSPKKIRTSFDAIVLYFGRFVVPIFLLFAYLSILL